MEKSTERSMSSVASGNSINSKLRYPLRSALRSKEGKPPVPDFSGSSVPRAGRGRVASAVSQSTTVLDLSAKKSVDRTKPPRRLSIPTKATSNSSVKSVSSIASVSENKSKRSGKARSFNETPVSGVLRSMTRRKVEDLSSSAYWLSHIKLAESVTKHSISLGFFKLAFHAGCEPIDQMKQELKSYARRNNLDGLADALKELVELYKISEESKQMQISETSSVVAEETTVSLNSDNDVRSSFSIPGNTNITPEILKDDALKDSAVIATTREKEASETILQEEVVQESEEGSRSSKDGVPNVTVVQPSDKKRVNMNGTVSKNSQPVRTKKSLAANSANTRTVSENKSQRKAERITKPRPEKIQGATKKSTKKSAAKEGEVKSVKQMENKENSVVVGAGEESQV